MLRTLAVKWSFLKRNKTCSYTLWLSGVSPGPYASLDVSTKMDTLTQYFISSCLEHKCIMGQWCDDSTYGMLCVINVNF